MKFRLIVLLGIWILSIISVAQAQTSSSISISMTEQNWDQDMKAIKETTPDRGLILQINIQNGDNSLTATLSQFVIQYQLQDLTNTAYQTGIQQTTYPTLVIPNATTTTLYISVLPPGTQAALGDRSLKVSYGCSSLQWNGPGSNPYQYNNFCSTPGNLEPYPLNFRVASESQLQSDIQQNKNQRGAPLVVISSPLVQIGGPVGLITAILVIVGIYLKKRG